MCWSRPRTRRRCCARLCDPAVKIVTLTVTEKGYCYDPATTALDEAHPDIVHDLANPAQPRTAPGFLVEALRRRRAAQRPLVHGAVLRQPSAQWPHGPGHRHALCGAARSRACRLHRQRGRVPLHDGRPHHAGDHRRGSRRDRSALGLDDAAPVITEPFSQWVIEDRFPERPPGLVARGRRIRHRRCAVREHEAAAAQRQPFDAGLSGLSRRLRDRVRHHAGRKLSPPCRRRDGRCRRPR